jgi:hypothetical protein
VHVLVHDLVEMYDPDHTIQLYKDQGSSVDENDVVLLPGICRPFVPVIEKPQAKKSFPRLGFRE